VREDINRIASPTDIGHVRVNVAPIKQALRGHVDRWINVFLDDLKNTLTTKLGALEDLMTSANQGLTTKVTENDSEGRGKLDAVMRTLRSVNNEDEKVNEMFEPLGKTVAMVKKHGVKVDEIKINGKEVNDVLEDAPMAWKDLMGASFRKKEEIFDLQKAEQDKIKEEAEVFWQKIREFRTNFRANGPFAFQGEVQVAYDQLDAFSVTLFEMEDGAAKLNATKELYDLPVIDYNETKATREELGALKGMWDFKANVGNVYADWKTKLWNVVDTEALDDQNKGILKNLRFMGNENPVMKGWQVYRDIEEAIKNMVVVLPLMNELHNPSMRQRHWSMLATTCGVKTIDPGNPKFTLNDIMCLNLHLFVDDVSEIVETAQKELKIETKLAAIEKNWNSIELDYTNSRSSPDIKVIKPGEEVVEGLDADQLELQTIFGMGKFMEFFKDRVINWQSTLGLMQDTLQVWETVTRGWGGLEPIFLYSEDIRSRLPDDTKRFEGIHNEFVEVMKDAVNVSNCRDALTVDGREGGLRSMKERLDLCQKSLNEYLDVKKTIFPRFYFVSAVALLDMLANGTNPPKIMPYLGDCYDALANCKFIDDPETGQKSTKTVDLMIAKDKETTPLEAPFTMEGEVEKYLNQLTEAMQRSLKSLMSDACDSAALWDQPGTLLPREKWLFEYNCQNGLTTTQIFWTAETTAALEEYELGQEDAVKKYLQLCNERLNKLIELVLLDLKKGDRVKIITLITMDVHSRDVVDKCIVDKIEGPGTFLWQQQLRFYWQETTLDCAIKICDYQTLYFYEWVGNTGRLVITPLTDRCYITLTMALRLFLGGAPAGPAGTGKTETTKDLARAFAIPCYVFNCSDQMNFQTMADIFRGLAQTGAWGCFDEFNRISIEVLSVVASQVKVVQDAIVKNSIPVNRDPEYQHHPAGTPPVTVGFFEFEGGPISLIPTCGFFITMNPGYAGRTELPENLKALFRSCAMIRPDLKPICENMLMSEGFQTARMLAIKFVTLYQLSSELLSKQPHYDWGLRAVKSVLRVAGAMKRTSPGATESEILMRALRDFNTPKIPVHDTPVFMRLIDDLFMNLTVPLVYDKVLLKKIARAAEEMKLQGTELFNLKTHQFQELLDVRHSVMLLGPAGCAKTQIWKCLQWAHNLDQPKKTCVAETVNPKSVSGNELYGYMTMSKEWKDGCLSIVMRGMAKCFAEQGFYEYQTYKWVVLDGDIDAVWIESMNTVMDDNKVLTLVSNERVPLSDAMRMVFEINSLKNATPATVSRAGILFINETDVGWYPMVQTWAQAKEDKNLQSLLPKMFDENVPKFVEMVRKGFKECTPLYKLNKVETVMNMLDYLLSPSHCPPESITRDVVFNYFMFAGMWAWGGPMVTDKQADYKSRFSEALSSTFPEFRLPQEGSCFDYFYNLETNQQSHWRTEVKEYTPIPIGGTGANTPFTQLSVSTVNSVRLTFIMDALVRRGRNVMFVGTAGTGKTMLVKEYLKTLDKDADGLLSETIVMSYYTESLNLQAELDLYIDKRAGRIFGPPATKKLVYFIDDMNLPQIETYGTQNAIALLTQQMQHGSVFDREDLSFRKDIVDVQYISAMNPTAGSFSICERAQIRFSTFDCAMPDHTDLQTIYTSIFTGHLMGFPDNIIEAAPIIVKAAITLLDHVSTKFLPSAVKFTYNWNMRELTNIFQGLCLSKEEFFTNPSDFVRLFIHESERVIQDRLVNEKDISDFDGMLHDTVKKEIEAHLKLNDSIWAENRIYTNFATRTDGSYLPIPSLEKLKNVLDAKLHEYNDSNAVMDLVLFNQALEHVCRVGRILMNPGGNAMLIGVGGSGKQSLGRLAAFIQQMEVKQMAITGAFKVDELKEILKEYYKMAIVKNIPIMWLMTDSQIVNDKFLIYINSILSSGWISDLFPKDEIDALLGAIRGEAKAAGVPDTPEANFAFLVKKSRCNFHVALCFSPVGDAFRVRARRFPGLINCTAIDFFHAWPEQALISVAERFVSELENIDDTIKKNLAQHMAFEHLSAGEQGRIYLETQRRYNYVTPKSFLELIEFYKFVLIQKRGEVESNIDRLDTGLATLNKVKADVDELMVDLKHTLEVVAEKVEKTDALLVHIGKEKEAANVQEESAAREAAAADKASAEAAAIQANADEELKEATPAMEAAAEAVDCLSKAALTELKGFNLCPGAENGNKVMAACLILIEHNHNKKVHTDLKKCWDASKKMMGDVGAFLTSLQQYNGRTIPEEEVHMLTQWVVDDPDFTYERMVKSSVALANLAGWVINIYKFNRIYVKVAPLMASLDAAVASKAAADASLAKAMAEVAEVRAKLAALGEQLQAAVNEKNEVQANAAYLEHRGGMADRLINGLSSEKVRWEVEIEKLRTMSQLLIGDSMLSAGFASYVGGFDAENREALWKLQWLPDIVKRGIPCSEGAIPLDLLTDAARTATMIGQGLPADQISIENGSIINNCKRWPLIIDPQVQGIKWLREKEEPNGLQVIQLTSKGWIRTMQNAIANGIPVIVENLTTDIDATLDPVLARAIVKKGRNYVLFLGGEEIEYSMDFRLYLQTKLANPHYKPEIAAQCTLVNFIATERGLEDQLLAKVVGAERPDLEETAQRLQQEFQQYKIQLMDLENDLLNRLANAPEDILSDVPLIEAIEATKATAVQINIAIEAGTVTEKQIGEAREAYRLQASEGAMLYFLLTKLCFIDHMYQYSLDSFVTFFFKSITNASTAENVTQRVLNLRDSLRITIFTWVARGLFVAHKLIFLGQLMFNLMKRGVLGDDAKVDELEFNFLMRGPRKMGEDNPIAWLPDSAWQTAQALMELPDFTSFCADLVEGSPRFKEWYNLVTPEEEKLPMDYAQLDKNPFKKMLITRCLRPDRMLTSMESFIRIQMPNGDLFADCDSTLNAVEILDQSYLDSTSVVPVYFILSPGANVVADLDIIAKKYGMVSGSTYHMVSMGQGQDVVAERLLEAAHREGHWVILCNIHLMINWLIKLEKMLDDFALEGSHQNFRVFFSSDPSGGIPIGILARCIKLTNEPPAGLKAKLKNALCFFPRELFEEADSKTKSILFGLCYYHGLMLERKAFGPLGYNMKYPFAIADLRDSAVCLQNYMENSGGGKIPWEDLKYIFGDIMYGGHIVNDFDRLMSSEYLNFIMKEELLDETEMYPFNEGEKETFKCPAPTTQDRYLQHINENMGADTPIAFGLHPNAEIDFRTTASDAMFRTILELQPRAAGGGGETLSPQQIAETVTQDILDRFAERSFDVEDVQRGLDHQGPYQNVLLQEMSVMNVLLDEIRRSLKELQLGFKGELTMSDKMEALMNALYMDEVPGSWGKISWPSKRGLSSWLPNFNDRLGQLDDWCSNPMETLKVTWTSGFVNPQAFLTAILQVAAQKNQWELDKLVTMCDVLKQMTPDEVSGHAKDGAYIHGLFLEGARWDADKVTVDKSRPKELFVAMPCMCVRGISLDRADMKGIYHCPLYITNMRGPTYVTRCQLKTKSPAARWVLAGVALIMDMI
jgi:dynein heavy chain